MPRKRELVGKFKDKYGDDRTLIRRKGVLAVERRRSTVIQEMNRVVGAYVGERIKQIRERKGMTLEACCRKMGYIDVVPKNRMWRIEQGLDGIRMGTVYAAAIALGVEVQEILPEINEVMELAEVQNRPVDQEVIQLKKA